MDSEEFGLNIWQEETSEQTVLYDESGAIKAGTLNKGVAYLTSETTIGLDYVFQINSN